MPSRPSHADYAQEVKHWNHLSHDPCSGDTSHTISPHRIICAMDNGDPEPAETQESPVPHSGIRSSISGGPATEHSRSEGDRTTSNGYVGIRNGDDEGDTSDVVRPSREDPQEAAPRRKILLSKVKISTMSDVRKAWQSWSEEHVEKQRRNPFSEEFDPAHAMAVRLQKGDRGYGRPQEGSKTEERGQRARRHIHKEMEELCLVIRDMGVRGRDGRLRVTFGRLFEHYVRVSDKVVGILLRARKHGMLDFEGEMLWQGVHDDTVITLLD